ncbi:bifunctional glutathionylspermidine amidase/glutathionylspermidine synthetase [Thraustotheca clavata]|uniref:Bifunctional glutathionylspermidine amidase/glutathionylspermidine synthetase n=1 Tax=Thraustotheca clavata TaxID=74557 RepID=A0A1V9ZD36_9STRA|nr:bifunctional glutathionylspermidine amidase/glutathionylspermidine synthetase [Thraustotheca clavata]
MKVEAPPAPVSFGTLLGITDGGVHVYCCDYTTLTDAQRSNRDDFKSIFNGITTGYKWQCVELGRRYLLVNYGVVFDNIAMAYDIFRLKNVRRVADDQLVPMHSNVNGEATELPVKGSLLIWNPVGEFERTGHISVIVDATNEYVDIVEQNVDDTIWPEGQNYSRRLKATVDEDTGAYTIHCTFGDSSILGWMTIDMETEYNYEDVPVATPDELQQKKAIVSAELASKSTLDASLPFIEVFQGLQGSQLTAGPLSYFTLTEHGQNALEYATDHLHHMFLDATDYVLHHEKELGPHFRIPSKLWSRIRRSWFRRKPDCVAGRFDFTLTSAGLKVYEYNADSASCLLECGYVQDNQATALKLPGRSNSDKLFTQLIETWKARNVVGPLHLLCDEDPEEIYHTKYMQAAAEAAGLQSYMIVGIASFSRSGNDIVDADQNIVRNVWKTWSWRTALNELSDDEWAHYHFEDDPVDPKGIITPKLPGLTNTAPVKLTDILLHPSIRIFEPLWTILPSSKAILPVLSKLYPKHPLLLSSSYDLTPSLNECGYVMKPVAGRAGANITIIGPDGSLLSQTEGRWADDTPIYQELALLPKYGGKYVQLGTWAIGGKYGGTVVRVDSTNIIRLDSAIYPIRVIANSTS